MKKAVKWLENFWYHYKTHTMIIAFFAVVLIVCTVQMVKREDVDIYIVYAGPVNIGVANLSSMESAIEQVMSEDYNGDGKRSAQILDLTMLSDAQLEAEKKAAEEAGEAVVINAQTITDIRKRFSNEMFAGESLICLLDPVWYENVRDNGGLMTLAEALGYKPKAAFEDTGIYLRDTAFAGFFSVFGALPEDTVLCVRRLQTVSFFKGQANEERRHAAHVKAFRDIIAFTPPES